MCEYQLTFMVIKSGVRQGSVLGSIFEQHFYQQFRHTKQLKFADDVNLIWRVKSV